MSVHGNAATLTPRWLNPLNLYPALIADVWNLTNPYQDSAFTACRRVNERNQRFDPFRNQGGSKFIQKKRMVYTILIMLV